MSLRHGVNSKYIIKTLNKVDENITSFAKALTKYLVNIFQKKPQTNYVQNVVIS